MKHKNPSMLRLVALVRENGGSDKLCEFLATMTDRKWKQWKPRYKAIVRREGKALTRMTWWEKEFDRVMHFATYKRPNSQYVQ